MKYGTRSKHHMDDGRGNYLYAKIAGSILEVWRNGEVIATGTAIKRANGWQGIITIGGKKWLAYGHSRDAMQSNICYVAADEYEGAA